MKFIHIADMHFDIPFTTLSKNNLGNERRLEQRKIFGQIIDYIKKENIEYLFICGDLYEHEYIQQNTIEYINNLFMQIPNTNIYIVPGNHDPLIKNSYYNKFNWNKNVYIFTEQIQKITKDNIDIYGFGFNDFYSKEDKLEKLTIQNPEKINILLTHATLDATVAEEKNYNPVSKTKLKSLKFDYIALGHIHKPSYKDEINQNIIYPGSPIGLGFDELGTHGMIKRRNIRK